MPMLELLRTKKPVAHRPIWVMRQAGRYLPEYREVRKNFKSFIDFCLTPEAASEVTLQPIKRFGFDAAIIFSDILILPHALGVDVNFIEGFGPKLTPIRTEGDLAKYSEVNEEVFNKVGQALKLTAAKLESKTNLIGFAGSPWTVAAYMTEGSGSKTFSETFKVVYGNPNLFAKLIEKITIATIEYLKVQIQAGAQIIKLFDSWSGLVPCGLYDQYVTNPTMMIVSELKKSYPNVPVIGFPKSSGLRYAGYAANTGIDAIALDQSISLDYAVKNFSGLVLQGNFDNMLLAYGSEGQITESAKEILDMLGNTPHIFNLGHGILPETPIKNVEALIEVVRKYEGRS